eukprot:CAMPEP_0168356688 /NCGR_PEP_ID=MMETSP0228-20121227/178_1 /TAXON_ID=133427 /ORGANISM="Protoceratium reticulatum, Strain CCCM 535 (=CCMP 1889)" /LENGTH=71 /DNA_ID=CAMNT_0008369139 /DNA_START=98 /DNA_END=310 /DNA_ORIENTATION=-
MPMFPDDIIYSDKYEDTDFEYRHVILPKPLAAEVFRITGNKRLMQDCEWRALGVQGSAGWIHYEIHPPEPH